MRSTGVCLLDLACEKRGRKNPELSGTSRLTVINPVDLLEHPLHASEYRTLVSAPVQVVLRGAPRSAAESGGGAIKALPLVVGTCAAACRRSPRRVSWMQ